MEAFRTGYVYIYGEYAGMIMETEGGYSFAYDAEYLIKEGAKAVSLTMPLRTEEYTSHVLFPFFDGLIPEGWLLDVVVRNWKIDRKDRFGLMLVACKDCIGSVTVRGEKV